jgi:hypothetical protein
MCAKDRVHPSSLKARPLCWSWRFPYIRSCLAGAVQLETSGLRFTKRTLR